MPRAALSAVACLSILWGSMVVGGYLSPTLADDPLSAAKHRQMVMDRLGDDAKLIKLYLVGGTDHAAATAAARDLEAAAAIVPSLFPKGTGSDALPGKSAAKPDIWDNPDDFAQLEETLASQSTALRKTVDTGDVESVKTSFRTLAKTACGACHESYRGQKDGG